MHLADRFQLPAPYSARRYDGQADHAAMSRILSAYRESFDDPGQPTEAEFDVTYAALTDCDPGLDIYLIDHVDTDGATATVAYGRVSIHDLADGQRDCVVFAPALPGHISEQLFVPLVLGQEAHLADRGAAVPLARYRAYASHPGPGLASAGEGAWLEQLGYEATEFGATLRRPNLDDIPELPLPRGVEVRPVDQSQLRDIVAAHHECFRGEWDFVEIDESIYSWILDNPHRDETLWQIAWAGDTIVGQVKPFINEPENEKYGRLRGYTEFISTHHEWRNQGIAGALLAMSMLALKDRGMTEAMLGVDTNNAGGAFQLYTKLGFEMVSYEAVYTKAIPFSP